MQLSMEKPNVPLFSEEGALSDILDQFDLPTLRLYSLDAGFSHQFETEVENVKTIDDFVKLLAGEDRVKVESALREWSKLSHHHNNNLVSRASSTCRSPTTQQDDKSSNTTAVDTPSTDDIMPVITSKFSCKACPLLAKLMAPHSSSLFGLPSSVYPFVSTIQPQLSDDASLSDMEVEETSDDDSNHGDDDGGDDGGVQILETMVHQSADVATSIHQTESHDNHQRGFQAVPVDKECGLMCIHCHCLLRDPIQTGDGIRLCKACYLEIKCMPGPCDDCGITVTDDKVHTFPDKAVALELVRLLVYCTYNHIGCDWVGPLKEWEDHCTQCDKSHDHSGDHMMTEQVASYNGALDWKIPHVAMKRKETLESFSRQTFYNSPFFYTGRHGYKMCCRLYLNGDGIGLGTHISLFFVIMRGEYDDILTWPFEHAVSLILVDQTHRNDIVDSFMPSPDSSSFKKPMSDMNVASGCPQFASIDVLQDERYVADDTMFIKCIVDTSKVSELIWREM